MFTDALDELSGRWRKSDGIIYKIIVKFRVFKAVYRKKYTTFLDSQCGFPYNKAMELEAVNLLYN